MKLDLNPDDLRQTIDEWCEKHDVTFEQENDTFKLSWPADGNTAYIDLCADPKRKEVLVVQHGVVDSDTNDENQCGITHWRWQELDKNLTALKRTVDTMNTDVIGGADGWKYTPSIDIGTVKGFKFR